jgi:hypothetical protein
VADESLLSDDLLRQLMATGHVDILVGVPTLNNAATVVDVVRSGRDAVTVPVSSLVASRTSAGVPSSDPLSALKMRLRARGK